jgi:hypothetical protein
MSVGRWIGSNDKRPRSGAIPPALVDIIIRERLHPERAANALREDVSNLGTDHLKILYRGGVGCPRAAVAALFLAFCYLALHVNPVERIATAVPLTSTSTRSC